MPHLQYRFLERKNMHVKFFFQVQGERKTFYLVVYHGDSWMTYPGKLISKWAKIRQLL